jgi:hypothetical protein
VTSQVTVSSFENPLIPDTSSRKSVTKAVFGDLDPRNFDPKVYDKIYAEKTQEATKLFEGRLKDILSKAGLNPNEKFSYEIAPNGQLVIDGSDAVKTFFQQAFKQDPVLMKDMEGISATNDHVAHARMNAAYANEWFGASLLGGQDEVASKFKSRFSEMYQSFNKVSYAEGSLGFPAIDYVNRTLGNPI